MESIKFNSLEELYKRLVPAMETKVSELERNGIKYINIEDIWDYLRLNKWSKSKDLTLSRCVDDILNTSDIEYKKYIKNKMSDILGGDKNEYTIRNN